MEAWILLPTVPRVAAREAAVAEQEGFDGVLLADSQNLAAELVVELALCAAAISSIRLSPGVTNAVTRHPVVLAGAMATLQAESGGRIELGIGRGDSALAHLGAAPAPMKHFERYLRAVRGYLRGQEVPHDAGFLPGVIPSVETLHLGGTPDAGALHWLRDDLPPVPVAVAASGPKVIGLAATLGDAVTFSVGADPDRISWAVATARAARERAGLDPTTLPLQAWVNIAVHEDLDVAFDLVRGGLASFTRFSVMHGKTTNGTADRDADMLRELGRRYDMGGHGQGTAEHTTVLSRDFAKANAVVGDPDACLERLRELHELGITRFAFMGNFSRGEHARAARDNLAAHVLPELHSW